MGIFEATSRKHVAFLSIFFYCYIPYLFAQSVGFSNDMLSEKAVFLENRALIGIWENKERFAVFGYPDSAGIEDTGNTETKKLQTTIALKPFYRYYYDGMYALGKTLEDMPLAVFADGIYPEFWTSHAAAGGVFWRPENNRNDFSIETVPIARELTGYYTSYDLKTVYKIRYWITKADFTEEKAELRIRDHHDSAFSTEADALGGGEKNVFDGTILIDKYIKIGETVYTCATGRRTYVRNPEKLIGLPENAHIAVLRDSAFTEELTDSGEEESAKGTSFVLIFGEPLLKRSAVADLEAEIQAHNSIPYPPRNGRARFIEPSIYKKLETMDIDDFYNIRARVK